MNRTWRSCGRFEDPVILQLKLMPGSWPRLWWLKSEQDDSELFKADLQGSCKVHQCLETAYVKLNVRKYEPGNSLQFIKWNLLRISWASASQLHKSSTCSWTCLPALVGITCTRRYLKGQDPVVIISAAMPKGTKWELEYKVSNKALKHKAKKFWQSAVWCRQLWVRTRETEGKGVKGV